MFSPVYRPFSSTLPTEICTEAWSLALMMRFVALHLRGTYRSTSSPLSFSILSVGGLRRRRSVERFGIRIRKCGGGVGVGVRTEFVRALARAGVGVGVGCFVRPAMLGGGAKCGENPRVWDFLGACDLGWAAIR